MTAACTADDFPAQPSMLCGWCPYVEHCDVGLAEVRSRYNSGRIRAGAPALRLVAA